MSENKHKSVLLTLYIVHHLLVTPVSMEVPCIQKMYITMIIANLPICLVMVSSGRYAFCAVQERQHEFQAGLF